MNVLKKSAFIGISVLMVISCKKNKVEDSGMVAPTSIQTLLSSGTSPKEILGCGIPIDSLYGKSYQGGIIFYYDQVSEAGLVAAEYDLTEVWANWGCLGTLISGADGIEIGTGTQNTLDILSECSQVGTPAELCENSALNGYTDWFLPSKDELNAIYTNLKVNGLGGINDEQYWSSSEFDADNAWRQFLGIGIQNWTDGHQFSSSKDLFAVQCNVRAIRSF